MKITRNKAPAKGPEREDRPGISTLNELMTLYDEPFVKAAYQLILGRKADSVGLGYYANRLRRGHSRISVLHQLAKSSEAVEGWDELPGLRHAIERFQNSRRLKGWKLARADPELGRTPAARRDRILQNSVAAERQKIEESLSCLSVQYEIMKHIVVDLTAASDSVGAGHSSNRTDLTAHREIEVLNLRARRVEEIREFDLPETARTVLDTLRF